MKAALYTLWHVVATFGLVSLWAHHPTAVPPPPDAFIDWMLALHGAENGEDLSVVESHYVIVVSFLAVVIVTGLVHYFWKHRHKA